MSDQPITIFGAEASKPEVKRMSLVIWGPSGIGKTTLAATAPGRKALINFDPDGPSSITHVPDLSVFNLTGISPNMTGQFKGGDAFGLKNTFDHFDTYIIDSLTSIVEKTLGRGIDLTKGATLERPSPGAYQARNNLTMSLIRSVLEATYDAGKHVVFVAHESAPMTTDDGALLGYTLALGGQLPNNTAMKINEVWPMFEDGKNRKMIITRKSRLRDPAKSRMFITKPGQTEFEWRFDPEHWDDNKGMRIADWYKTWEENNFEKIPMPK